MAQAARADSSRLAHLLYEIWCDAHPRTALLAGSIVLVLIVRTLGGITVRRARRPADFLDREAREHFADA
jgi:hypothetical protein